jgi:hypothetical protein
VADEMVGDVAEVIRGDDRVGKRDVNLKLTTGGEPGLSNWGVFRAYGRDFLPASFLHDRHIGSVA